MLSRRVFRLTAAVLWSITASISARAGVWEDCLQSSDADLQIQGCTLYLEGKPSNASAHVNRGNGYNKKRDYDRALADYDQAIRLKPDYATAYHNRGLIYRTKRDYDRAIVDFDQAIRLQQDYAGAHYSRGFAYQLKGDYGRALADFRAALKLPSRSESDRSAYKNGPEKIATLERFLGSQSKAATAPVGGRRVALVIGNSAYSAVGHLTNPANDARAVAASFRRLGFAEVIERHDLTAAAMTEALKAFGDQTVDADWAVVYFAGHGIEMAGTPYLIPVDARLLRDSHVSDEAIPLERVLAKVETARKLRLVILDSCRNNPFVGRMVRASAAGRSIGSGLARIEPEGGVLVAYAAKHGTIALDGVGGETHSPFTEALLAHIEEPGLEINFLFRKVRDKVLERSGRAQEPFVYGSLGSDQLYFNSGRAK
jgi:tetratricopeptide (TPR) repeat protein